MVDELENMQPENQEAQEPENNLSGEDGFSDNEEVEESQEQAEEVETPVATVSEEKKEEIPSWAFNKMSKKIKNEVERAVTGAIQAIIQQPYQQPQQEQVIPDYSYNAYQDPMQTSGMTEQQRIEAGIQSFIAKQAQAQQIKEQEIKKQAFNAQVEAARDRYEDYDDFVAEATPYFTQPMYSIVSELQDGVDNFKQVWNENKDAIMKIQKLSPFMQAAETKRLLDDMSARKAAAKFKPTSSKPISPIKSSSSDAVKETQSSFMDSVKARYKRI